MTAGRVCVQRRLVLGAVLAAACIAATAVRVSADDGPPVTCAHGSTAVTTKCEMTLARENGLTYVQQHNVALSSDGLTAWVGGLTVDSSNIIHYIVAAYNTTSGALLWHQYYSSPIGGHASGFRMAVSPDDRLVAVTGQALVQVDASTTGYRAVTAVWDASTGALQWTTQTRSGYEGYRMAFAPDSRTLYVGGQVYTYGDGVNPTTETGDDWTIAAYDTSTGAERWYQTISANYIVGNNGDFLDFLSVSPDGSTVAATGRRPESGIDDGFGHNRGDEWGTALLDSATGTVRWLQTYAGGLGYDYPHDVEFSPDGQTLVVSGEIQLVQGTFIAAVVAYHAADGTQVWAQRITPSSGGASFAPALTVDGSHAYVAMQWDEQGTAADYVTQSLSLADGTAQWTATYAQPGSDTPTAIVLAADGATVYVTGQSQQPLTDYDATTVAYRTDTGAERWVANYAGPGPMDNQADIDESIASARHATRIAVAATSPSADGNTAAALLIYDVSSEVTPPDAVPELPLSPALFALASVLLVVVLRRRRHP